MVPLLFLFLNLLISPLKPTGRLEAENAALRQQISSCCGVSCAAASSFRTAIAFSSSWLYRLFPSILKAILIIRPDTLVRWHRAGFRRYWWWKSRLRVGRPPIERKASGVDPADERRERPCGARRAHSW